jgi:UV DNA damage repair endonuclease
MNKNIPLIVDLDHTLIDTDLLFESSIAVWLLCVRKTRERQWQG